MLEGPSLVDGGQYAHGWLGSLAHTAPAPDSHRLLVKRAAPCASAPQLSRLQEDIIACLRQALQGARPGEKFHLEIAFSLKKGYTEQDKVLRKEARYGQDQNDHSPGGDGRG